MLKLHFIKSLVMAVAAFSLVFAPVSALASNEMAAEVSKKRAKSYVAIGDSVASGLGLPYVSGATAEDIACGRSDQAYSTIVAAKLDGNPEASNIACQGAKIDNLLLPQVVGTTIVPAQLDVAFAEGTPRYITMTMGANDVQWATFIGACFVTTCDTAVNSAAAAGLTAAMKTKMQVALADIQLRSHGAPPKMAVTGYYQPMSDNCVALPGITLSEIAWLREQTNNFNAAIQSATEGYSFASYVPIDFTGHDICSADPWIQRPGGYPGEPAPFHPNATGQQVMAAAVLQTLGY